jgi:hypothetical protein
VHWADAGAAKFRHAPGGRGDADVHSVTG